MSDKTGIELIAAERKRQIKVEGWTPEHDDHHTTGDLADAAGCYAFGVQTARWPWGGHWWKPSDGSVQGRIRELVKAGALIAAEIDRLTRAEIAKAP